MTTQVYDEPFHLTDNDSGNITEADGTSSSWSDIWKYQVPVGNAIGLQAAHTFSLYLEDTSPAEVGNSTCQVRIRVRDPSESGNVLIYGPALYFRSKEFQERPLKATLSVREMKVPERYWIVIEANDDATIDASDSYFDLLINRVRSALR